MKAINKIETGDFVEFSEDEWNTVYRGTVTEVLINTVYIKSRIYGNVYMPKANVKIIKKYDTVHPNNNG